MTTSRLDRILAPEVSLALSGSAPGWPLVLYFHHVSPVLDTYTSVTPEAFALGLGTVLDVYGRALDPAVLDDLPPAPPDEPTVLVTFDDGHRDTLDHAVPILDRFGVKAVFFPITGLADAEPYHDRCLNWTELGELRAAGHVIGAHTVTHRKLPELDTDEQRHEVVESLDAVRERLGVDSPPLAYPYGLLPTAPVVPARTLAFGTVKASARPWTEAPHEIRRTYLPVGHEELWPFLCREWRSQWSRPSP